MAAPEQQQAHGYSRSQAWARRAQDTDAWAATRKPVLGDEWYPPYAGHASGAYLWDLDGNRYIDYVLGFGAVVLGHADPRVTRAVTGQLDLGTCVSPTWSPRQVELTELLASVVPAADMAYVMRTGSDATSGAVRLARVHTGRDKVVRWGYNGWHDWASPGQAGVPASVQAETLGFEYNDIASLERLFDLHAEQIACVVMMPFEVDMPAAGFLQEVQAMAHDHGALFILDELRSGFRMALGGAQEYFGLTPDLSTFGKAMANGYAVSAIVGRGDVLRCLDRTHMVSTSYGNAAEMTAALATIGILRDSDAIARLWRLGDRFVSELRAIVAEYALPAEVVGYPIAPFLRFTRTAQGFREARTAFFATTTRRGVLFHPKHQWFLSAAHTDEDITFTIDACRAAAAASAAAS